MRALFDVSPGMIGTYVRGIPIISTDCLEEWIAANTADIAVLAVTAGAARDMFMRLVNCGIRAVLNFTPVDLDAPRDVTVQNVHLTDSMLILAYYLKEDGASA